MSDFKYCVRVGVLYQAWNRDPIEPTKTERHDTWQDCQETCKDLKDCYNWSFHMRSGQCLTLGKKGFVVLKVAHGRQYLSGPKKCTTGTFL